MCLEVNRTIFDTALAKKIAARELVVRGESCAGSAEFTPKFKVFIETELRLNQVESDKIDQTLKLVFLDRSRHARAHLIVPRGRLPVRAVSIKIVFI